MENGDLHKTIQELTIEVAVLKTRIDAKEHALAIQAKEYERRLHDLNDAHRLARDTLATYLPREIFDKEHNALQNQVAYNAVRLEETVNSKLYLSDKEVLSNWRREVDQDRSKQLGSKATTTSIISIMIALASLITTLLIRFLHD